MDNSLALFTAVCSEIVKQGLLIPIICYMIWSMEAKVCKYEIEIQAKIWSKNKEIYEKIDNTNALLWYQIRYEDFGLDQTNPEIEC